MILCDPSRCVSVFIRNAGEMVKYDFHPLDWTPIKAQPVIHSLFSELDPTPFVGPATALKVALRSSKNVPMEGIYIYL